MSDEICPTCGHKVTDPYRVYAGDKITAGCVDKSHTGQLVTPSQSSAWHNRPEAKKIRAASAAFLKPTRKIKRGLA